MGGSIVFTKWRQCAPPSNTCFLEPTQVHIPNGISVGSATFAGLIIVTHRPTDQPTDRPRYSAYNNRPRVCTQYCNVAQLLAYNKNSKLSVLHQATMQNRFAVLCLWLTMDALKNCCCCRNNEKPDQVRVQKQQETAAP